MLQGNHIAQLLAFRLQVVHSLLLQVKRRFMMLATFSASIRSISVNFSERLHFSESLCRALLVA
jgi:hypothetical protein